MYWVPAVFSMHLRKILSYRIDFWVKFFGKIAAEIAIAYFLWTSIFQFTGKSEIGGFSFSMMMLYYSIMPFVAMIVVSPGENLLFSTDIYEGTVTKFIIYPVNFIGYKFLEWLSHALIAFLQLTLSLLFVVYVLKLDTNLSFSVLNGVMFFGSCLVGTTFYFLMTASLELIAFWADNVWSLSVMLRFMSMFLGGAYIPLTLFPDWVNSFVQYLPFPYLLSYPVKILLGQISLDLWVNSIFILLFWIFIMGLICKTIWHFGKYKYTGVGI